jgi:hypothetical protein
MVSGQCNTIDQAVRPDAFSLLLFTDH